MTGTLIVNISKVRAQEISIEHMGRLWRIGSQPLGHDPLAKPLSSKVFTLWFIKVGKLQLYRSNKNNFMGGDHHNIRDCIKGSQH